MLFMLFNVLSEECERNKAVDMCMEWSSHMDETAVSVVQRFAPTGRSTKVIIIILH